MLWFAIAFVMAAAAIAVPVVREWLAVDACLDSGGAWIKQASKCSHDQAEIDRYRSPR